MSDVSEGKPKVFSVRNDKGIRIEIDLFNIFNIEGKFYVISNRRVHEEDHSMREYWKVI
jgi:hypothetical protein